MQVRISYKRTLMALLVILLALLEVKWFYLPTDLSSILVRYNLDGRNSAIVGVSTVLLIAQLTLFRNKKRSFVFKNHIILLWMIWLFAYSYAVLMYGQSAWFTFSQFFYFGVYLLYFALQWYFESCDSYEFFNVVFTICSVICSILIIAQALTWQSGGDFFLTILQYQDGDIIVRNNMIRIYAPAALLSICTVISFGRIFQDKKRKLIFTLLNVVNVIAGTVYIFYASGTRFYMLILMISFGLILLFKKQGAHLARNILIYGAVIGIIYYALTQNVFSLLAFDTEELSFTYRMGAFAYFLMQGLINPICGLGFLTDQAPEYASLLHGPDGTYYISDVGIIGFAGQMGIIAAVIYLAMIIKIWKINFKLRRMTGRFNPVVLGIACYVTLTATTLSLQTNYSIIAMVLSMVVAEYEFRHGHDADY